MNDVGEHHRLSRAGRLHQERGLRLFKLREDRGDSLILEGTENHLGCGLQHDAVGPEHLVSNTEPYLLTAALDPELSRSLVSHRPAPVAHFAVSRDLVAGV